MTSEPPHVRDADAHGNDALGLPYWARTSTTSRGRRARDFIDVEAHVRASRRCRRCEMRLLLQPEHAGQESRHFDATAATLKLLRRVVRAVSVRPHHDRRSGVSERQRRHGIPDALHRRARVDCAGARRRSPKR